MKGPLPENHAVETYRGETSFYCQECLRWCEVIGVTVDGAIARHVRNVHGQGG